MKPRKRFGQHFLEDASVIDRMLRIIDPKPGECVVEIGPGQGALTSALAGRCDSLTVIELDRDLVPMLQDRYGATPGFRVLQADALTVDYGSLADAPTPIRVVGNLPYNISTPLLFHLLRFSDRITDMHFMLQKEVVDRLCATPGSSDYGRLSVGVAVAAEAQSLFDVGPEAFRPPPRVQSAVVRLAPRAPDFEIRDRSRFDRVVREAFNHRRKTLGNALKGVCTAAQIEAAGIDVRRRPDTIAPAEFAALANALY